MQPNPDHDTDHLGIDRVCTGIGLGQQGRVLGVCGRVLCDIDTPPGCSVLQLKPVAMVSEANILF